MQSYREFKTWVNLKCYMVKLSPVWRGKTENMLHEDRVCLSCSTSSTRHERQLSKYSVNKWMRCSIHICWVSECVTFKEQSAQCKCHSATCQWIQTFQVIRIWTENVANLEKINKKKLEMKSFSTLWVQRLLFSLESWINSILWSIQFGMTQQRGDSNTKSKIIQLDVSFNSSCLRSRLV